MSNVDVDSHKLTIFSLSLTTRNMTDYGKNYVKYCGIKLLVNQYQDIPRFYTNIPCNAGRFLQKPRLPSKIKLVLI